MLPAKDRTHSYEKQTATRFDMLTVLSKVEGRAVPTKLFSFITMIRYFSSLLSMTLNESSQ
jgi:hypothetical protein